MPNGPLGSPFEAICILRTPLHKMLLHSTPDLIPSAIFRSRLPASCISGVHLHPSRNYLLGLSGAEEFNDLIAALSSEYGEPLSLSY